MFQELKVINLQKQGFGNIAGVPLGSGANPYFVRMASSPSATVLEDAVSQDPTFFTISVMGGNDVSIVMQLLVVPMV